MAPQSCKNVGYLNEAISETRVCDCALYRKPESVTTVGRLFTGNHHRSCARKAVCIAAWPSCDCPCTNTSHSTPAVPPTSSAARNRCSDSSDFSTHQSTTITALQGGHGHCNTAPCKATRARCRHRFDSSRSIALSGAATTAHPATPAGAQHRCAALRLRASA